MITTLHELIRERIDYRLARPTRIHKLPTEPNGGLWIKREDELSSGISGSKLRKYASLLPFLKKSGTEVVGMIGGPNSNNLVGLAQILREHSIHPLAFIREAADPKRRGNALLLDMLLTQSEVRFVPRDQWSSVLALAHSETARTSTQYHILPEGAWGLESLFGAMSLAEDLLRNEKEEGTTFQRLYHDSGTGLGAIGLILGLEAILGPEAIKREIVVTLIAGKEAEFKTGLETMRANLREELAIESPDRVALRFLKPPVCPKFGSVNKSLIDETRNIARSEGLLMDPTYSSKHYLAAKADFAANSEQPKSLFILNGSALGLCGFQDALSS